MSDATANHRANVRVCGEITGVLGVTPSASHLPKKQRESQCAFEHGQ
jgi:hypothetical protein